MSQNVALFCNVNLLSLLNILQDFDRFKGINIQT